MSGCCSKDEKPEAKSECCAPSQDAKTVEAKETNPVEEKSERTEKRGCGYQC